MTNTTIKNIIEEELNRFDGKLYIFDFDETLISDKAVAYIVKSDGRRIPISHKEYKDYVPEPGDQIDISEFDQIVNPTVHTSIMKILKSVEKNSVILTARTKDKPISNFLNQFGITVPVFAVGSTDPKLICSAYNARKKAEWIENAINTFKLEYIEFWDDNRYNLYAAEKLMEKYINVVIKTHLVDFK